MALDSSVSRSDPTPLYGMMLAATAFALLTSVDTIFKLIAENHPPYQIILVNSCFAVVPILIWAFATGGPARLHTERPFLHFIRGSVGTASGLCAIYAYSDLPLANFYAIVFTGPLIVTAMSALWLGEKIGRGHWIAIASGFGGVLVVMNPLAFDAYHDSFTTLIGRLAAIASVLCYSLSVTMVRRMRLAETNLTFSLYGYIASTIIGGMMLLIWNGPALHANDFARLALSGSLAGAASICLMTAYHRSPVALVAPFQYTQIFWGALAGWLLWQQVPDRHLIAGAAIVAASGLFVIYREMQITNGKRRI